MYFLLINFVYKIINKKVTKDVLAISTHLKTIVTMSHTFKYQNCCLPKKYYSIS